MSTTLRSLLVCCVLLLSAETVRAGLDEADAAYLRDDYATALREYRRLAEQGHAGAQYALGVMYHGGRGVPQDYVEAMRWFRLAAEQGNSWAQFNLGSLYNNGEGVPQDHVEARRWYRLAAEQGNSWAQFNLGFLYNNGEGVPQDHVEARRWYRLAAEQGFAAAQFNLGLMYNNGEGVPQDYVEAMRWYRRAAEQGYAKAQSNLGVMYGTGEGVPQDYVQAHRWYNLSAANQPPGEDRDTTVKNREIVAARMTPAQLAEAQRQAREWRASDEPSERRAPSAPGPDRSLMADVQAHLSRLGFNPGPVDGMAGPATRRAVIAYQRSRKLSLDGQITAALLERLRADQGAAAPMPTVPSPRPALSSSVGTAFYVSEAGHLLTNAHVVEDCREISITLPPGAPLRATVVATDLSDDLALLKAPRTAPAVAQFRSGVPPRIGEPLVVYGFPLSGALASSGNLVTGTLSALAGLRDNPRHYQISAPVQPGNSGGPLLDERAQVIGVVVGKLNATLVAELTGDIPQNVNFAIKASAATGFLEANGVDPGYRSDRNTVTPAEAAEAARAFTVRVECKE